MRKWRQSKSEIMPLGDTGEYREAKERRWSDTSDYRRKFSEKRKKCEPGEQGGHNPRQRNAKECNAAKVNGESGV